MASPIQFIEPKVNFDYTGARARMGYPSKCRETIYSGDLLEVDLITDGKDNFLEYWVVIEGAGSWSDSYNYKTKDHWHVLKAINTDRINSCSNDQVRNRGS